MQGFQQVNMRVLSVCLLIFCIVGLVTAQSTQDLNEKATDKVTITYACVCKSSETSECSCLWRRELSVLFTGIVDSWQARFQATSDGATPIRPRMPDDEPIPEKDEDLTEAMKIAGAALQDARDARAQVRELEVTLPQAMAKEVRI